MGISYLCVQGASPIHFTSLNDDKKTFRTEIFKPLGISLLPSFRTYLHTLGSVAFSALRVTFLCSPLHAHTYAYKHFLPKMLVHLRWLQTARTRSGKHFPSSRMHTFHGNSCEASKYQISNPRPQFGPFRIYSSHTRLQTDFGHGLLIHLVFCNVGHWLLIAPKKYVLVCGESNPAKVPKYQKEHPKWGALTF